MGRNSSTTFARYVINVFFPYPCFTSASFGQACERSTPEYAVLKPWLVHITHHVLLFMASVVRIEPNGNQALLLFDNAQKDLEDSGCLTFVQRFEGFNLFVAQQFFLTFDGCRDKVGDIQLELNEEFIRSTTGLASTGQQWFKNSKVNEVPWPLLFVSWKVTSCDKGMPISTLKPRWHDLLIMVKQFVTCEGRYGLVFLYHLRLSMNFMGYPLNIPFYYLRSLYKMSKKFKWEKDDSSLFHHGLIRLIAVHHLNLHGDNWQSFLSWNGFVDSESVQIDKSVVNETKVGPPVPFHALLPSPKPSVFPDIDLPDIITDKVEVVKKPVSKKVKGNPIVNSKGKNNAQLISRLAQNKHKPNVDQKPIVLSEDSDSDIERFLAGEYPYSHGLCSEPPYNFVSNLPPCLKNNPSYPRIKLPNETLGDMNKPLTFVSKPEQTSCNQCNVWLERYYTDIPLLQLKIKSLENQVTVLSRERDKLQAN